MSFSFTNRSLLAFAALIPLVACGAATNATTASVIDPSVPSLSVHELYTSLFPQQTPAQAAAAWDGMGQVKVTDFLQSVEKIAAPRADLGGLILSAPMSHLTSMRQQFGASTLTVQQLFAAKGLSASDLQASVSEEQFSQVLQGLAGSGHALGLVIDQLASQAADIVPALLTTKSLGHAAQFVSNFNKLDDLGWKQRAARQAAAVTGSLLVGGSDFLLCDMASRLAQNSLHTPSITEQMNPGLAQKPGQKPATIDDLYSLPTGEAPSLSGGGSEGCSD